MSIKSILLTFGVIMLALAGLQAINYSLAMISAPSDASVYGGVAILFFTLVVLLYGIRSYVTYMYKAYSKPKETKKEKENQ